MRTESDIAWAAGFFDGEGTISIYENHKREAFTFGACASQKKLSPLLKLQILFGGTIRKEKRKVHLHTWSISGMKALTFLCSIRGYSIVKQKEIDLAIEFYEQVDRNPSTNNRPLLEGERSRRRVIVQALKDERARCDTEALQ